MMEAFAKKRRVLPLYLWYTFFFAVAAVITFSFFAIYKKAFIWQNDGLYQHYNAFLYFGKWAREIVRNVFVEHNFAIPMWEWGFGAGSDGIGFQLFYDPFCVFSVFTPTKYAEFVYGFTVILRLYLAGVLFCAYCKKMNCIKWTTVCAAIMYVFCAYTIFTAPRHPYFVNTMIYMPLIFLGCENILQRKSFLPFSIGVALAALNDFYFFYMIVLLTIIYAAIRLLSDREYRVPKIFWGNVGRLFIYAIIGVATACVLFLPTVMSFIENNTRVNDTYTFSPFYSGSQYSVLPGSLVSATELAVSWGLVGMAPIAYIAVMGSFINRDKKQRFARIYFLLEIIFLCFPIFGHIFNGFGYVTNRWVFIWPLIPAFLFAKEFPEILKFDARKKGYLFLGCTVYTILCVLFEKSRVEVDLIGIVLLLAALGFIILATEVNESGLSCLRSKIRVSKKRFTQLVSAFLVFSSVFYIAFYRYSKQEKYYLNEFRDLNSGNSLLSNDTASVWELIKNKNFYRVDDSSQDSNQINYPVYSHQPTTTSFWSLNSKEYVTWRRLNSAYNYVNYLFKGLTSRAWLEPQYCAEYFVTSNKAQALASVPYGFKYQGKKEGFSGEYYLYKTENTLSFGSTYDSVMRRSDFEKLSIVERQQAALQSCVLDDDAPTSLRSDVPSYDDYELEYRLKCEKGAELDGNTLHIKNANSKITLSFDAPVKGELYVLFSGLSFQNGANSTKITANCGKAACSVSHFTERNLYSEGRTEYLLNLGYSEEARTKITLTFSNKGDYSFDELKVICQPMERLPEYVKARNEDVLENVKFDTNKISGTIDLDKTKFLCLSLPYSKGWTAYVDGQKVDLLHANIAFSGLELEAGHHEIELKFCTPYIKIGAVLSVLGIISLVICAVLFKYKKHIADKVKFSEHKSDKA